MHAPTTPGSRLRVLDASILLLVVLLAISSLAVWAAPGIARLADAGPLDLALNVAATVVGAAVAILAWIRWRETNEVVALYQSSAFVALTVINSFTVAVVLLGRQEEFGMSAGQPGEAPIYLWALTRLMAAFLLVLGAWQSLRRQQPVLPRLAISIGPAIVLAVVGVVLLSAEAALPAFSDARDLIPGGEDVGVASTLVAGLQVLGFVLFAVAAILFRRLYIRDRLPTHGFLAAGLVVAAFSQLHFALDPVVAYGVVPSSEVLRVAFHAILFMGVQAELESELGEVRRANGELRRLRDVDKAHAVLSERTRLARDIHDGLAQDLWYAKLKQGRLAQDRNLGEYSRADANEVLGAIDHALAEARQAVTALRTSPSAASSFEEQLRLCVDRFSESSGVRAEFTADGGWPVLPERTEAEVVRIVQEALNNVRKHADATYVRVTTDCDEGAGRVSITDNGRGFDPGSIDSERYGLRGMRERAHLAGAALDVVSRANDGTSVTVRVPLRLLDVPKT